MLFNIQLNKRSLEPQLPSSCSPLPNLLLSGISRPSFNRREFLRLLAQRKRSIHVSKHAWA